MIQKEIRQLLAKGKTKAAINQLLAYTSEHQLQDYHDQIVLISAKQEKYEEEKRLGVSSQDQQNLDSNRINVSLMKVLNLMEGKPSTNTPNSKIEDAIQTKEPPSSGKSWQIISAISVLIAIVAGIAEVSGYSLRDIFTSSSSASNTVTVLVHGKKGKDELVLPNRGVVKLIYGDAIVSKQINAEGEATFKQVNEVFFEKDTEVEIVFHDPEGEPYRNAQVDKKYKLIKGKYIPLEVHLFGLDKVSGIIKDFQSGEPVANARISIQREAVFSNEYGEFMMIIPEEKQQKFQTIRVSHESYQPYELSQVPIQTQKEISILLKPIE